MFAPSSQLVWAWILTVGPLVACMALWCYLSSR